MKCFIATVYHKHGFGAVGGGRTEKDAWDAIVNWCHEFWDWEAPPDEVEQPETDHELVERYFEMSGEQYDISECEIIIE